MTQNRDGKLTRRALLRGIGFGGMALIIAGCQPKVVERVVEKEVTKVVKEVVKETVIVAGTPQVVEKEVTKVVKETVVVEKEAEVAKPSEMTAEMWYWCGLGKNGEDFYRIQVMPLFNELYPNITVEFGQVGGSWQDLYNKLVTGAAGGAVPEVCRMKDYFTPDFAVRGVQADLTDYIDATPHLSDEMWVPNAWTNAHWNGKAYALPINIFIHYPHMSVELFEKAGLVDSEGVPIAPDTWEDWAETARKISDPDNRVYGTMLRKEDVSEGTTNAFHLMVAQAGGRLCDENFEKYTFNSPEGLEALNFVVSMIKNGSMKPLGMSIPNIHLNNQVGIWWHSANYWTDYVRTDPDFRWCTSINPILKTRGGIVRGNHLALFTAAKEIEAGWAWMSFHETPQIDYMYGVSQNFITAQVENHKKPYYEGGVGDNTCALFSTEFKQFEEPGNQNQPIFPGYQESSMKIAAQLQMAYMLEISPEEALEKAEEEANAVLAETRKLLGIT